MRNLGGIAIVLILGFGPAPGSWIAQEEPAVPAEPAVEDASAEAAGEEAGEPIPGNSVASSPIDEIDQILEGDDQVLAGGGYTYDRGDRRDPFLSPLRRQDLDLPRGPRPEGKPGLLIDEISLTGLFETSEGLMAQVRGGPKDKSYLLVAGDRLYDGEVVAVRSDEVEFKKIINDPAAVKPFREVVKRLSKK